MSRFGKQGQLITDKKLDDLKKQLQQTEDQINSVKKKIDDTESANFRNGEAPSAIVFHPAVQGRSLAWSAARTDFWFNNTERLFEEAKAVETEDGVAYDMRRIFEASKRGANTWQFFERDGTIELARVDSKTVLTVRADGDLGEDGRFAVSLFQVEGSNEDQARRLSEQESNIKRPIAWLERTHPDFWRLSDFSTSLMYLRYLKAHEIQLISFSQDDFDPKLATPEWIYKRTGEPVVRP
jgi:hypothetical protein